MAHERDDAELRRILETHSVEGYPVRVPLFGKGVVLSQSPSVGAFTYFLVQGDEAIPFEQWLSKKHMSKEQMTLAKWEENYAYGSRKLPHMQPELRELLETGGKVSMADIEFADLMARGCIDEEQRVTCQPFEVSQVSIEPEDLKKGMLVEMVALNAAIATSSQKDIWPCRVVSSDKTRVILDLLIPAPYLRMPSAIDNAAIKPGFHSRKIVSFGEGLVKAWKLKKKPLPAGQWTPDEKEYFLEEPLEPEVLSGFCNKYYPDIPMCFLQGLLMYVVPVLLDPEESEWRPVFRPLPEKSVPPEYVVPAIEE